MDTRRFRVQLVELRDRLIGRKDRVSRHLDRRDEPLAASPDQRSIDLENRDVLEELDATARFELQQVEHALARIETGEYGRCEGCRRPIQTARLEMVPFATRCAHCERTAEAG
ncbi:MAG: TraR/DksA family transcriptional regulator [Planctomycetota bacterium]|jgi:RNA polymerase-binding transcription factor DksA